MTHTANVLLRQSSEIVPEKDIGAQTRPQTRLQTTSRPGPYTIHVARSLAEMEQLKDGWLKLEQYAARSFHLFQSYSWCESWTRHYAGEDCHEIHITTIWRGRELVCLWPMMTTCAGPLCILRWLSDPYGQYGDALVHPDVDHETVLALAWRELCSNTGIDAIRLRHVRSDAYVHDFLKAHARAGNTMDTAPFLDLEKYASEAEYEARYNRQQRRRRKRIHKKLSALGKVSFSRPSGSEAENATNAAISQKRLWLKQRGLVSKPVTSARINAFINTLAAHECGLDVVVSVLKTAEREAAWEIGLRYKDRHCGFITAHDNELTCLSPARLHMDLSQRAAISDGCKIFDLMVPGDPHKKTWSSGSVSTCDFYQPLRLRGKVFSVLYLKLLRPLARKIYHGAPSRLRRLALALANRQL